jgi:hypothetical protein
MAHLDYYGEYMVISPREFLDSCTNTEKNQLRRLLIGEDMSVSEKIFEEHLEAIHGKWNVLSSEEEEQIMKIGKKFK